MFLCHKLDNLSIFCSCDFLNISKIMFHLDLSCGLHMSLDMRKPAFCLCENKDTDQLRGNREADQRLCFRHTDSVIPHLSKSKISSL